MSDKRQVFMNVRTGIPDKLLQIDGNIRRVKATNQQRDLMIYLYFSQPVLNSSLELLNALHASSGVLQPTNGITLGNRRFSYKVTGIGSMDVVTINCAMDPIISRQGTPVSVSDPFTFLYDAQRPAVRVSTTADVRTKEQNIPVIIKFVKPVFEFNSSSVLISGGHITSFREISGSIYTGVVHVDDSIVSIGVPENKTEDIAGNKNLASNNLQVRHYSVPIISTMVSTIATATFAATSMAAAILTVSTASLISFGVFSRPATYLILETTRNLVRTACHIQVFALSNWLTIVMPVEYYEFARGIEWSIPYINLPWETKKTDPFLKHSSPPVMSHNRVLQGNELNIFGPMTIMNRESESSRYIKPLTPNEYRSFLENQAMKPEAEFIMTSTCSDVWKYFGRNMFWLAVIAGGLIVLHAIFLLILRSRRRKLEEQKELGALVCPRLEVFILVLAFPSICQASSTLIRGGSPTEFAVGILLFCIAASLLLSLLLFLSIGITFGKLLQYKEVHQEGQEFRWYHELVRISLGPGKRGQWTWNNHPTSLNLVRFGPLFEDLRGPPKHMLSQISTGGEGKRRDRIIASEDENEDAEAPFIQKLFGVLRIYYTFLESAKRAALGVVAGAFYAENSSRVPILVVLSITSFQLVFLVLKKPFIERKVQLVEIISVSSEIGIAGSCLALLENDVSDSGQKTVGYFMIGLFAVSFVAQMMNEWYALYTQTVRLSSGANSFCLGLKRAAIGLLILVLPSNLLKEYWREELGTNDREGGGAAFSPTDGIRPSSGERPWLRQLRELAKAGFSRDNGGASKDPSTSRNCSGGFWADKRSGSSSVTSSNEFKGKGDMKAKGMHKDLEAIFSSK
ncbi:hypothetical protein KSP40_PGU018306 [Platanthera guangdongensis]|uniref:Bacterial Ig-like domain-containing protein n=1 Tax=Platanthera guangdongensis TaxID=2320717 RepID=A0ABR2N417_9ASPA